MPYFPYGPTINDVYTLTGPDGSVAVFNDSASGNYVGALTEITGLDSADVRESSEDLTEADGGSHGNFFYGRRPIVLTGKVYGHTTITARNTKLDRMMRASNAMRGDATLSWIADPTGVGMSMFTYVRRQQPLRISGGWVKDFQLALVSEYAYLFSSTLRSSGSIASGTPVVVENQGSADSYPIVSISNASTNPQVTNSTPSPSQVLKTTGLTMIAGETIQIDTLTHTATFTAGARSGQSANRYIDFGLTVSWPRLARGNNTFTLTGGGSMTLTWRDCWA